MNRSGAEGSRILTEVRKRLNPRSLDEMRGGGHEQQGRSKNSKKLVFRQPCPEEGEPWFHQNLW